MVRVAWLVAILVAGWGGWQVWRAEAGHTAPPSAPAAVGTVAPSVPPVAAANSLQRSAPVKISIASINVSASVDQIGLASDGTLEEQPLSMAQDAAWYRLGPSPGQVGPAVIVGHVDTKDSQAVFFKLGLMRPGAKVVITLADGHSATFAVDSVGTYLKTKFPTKSVYGHTSYPALRLITCGGPFDRVAGSYRDNIVVFAHLTSKT
jgi:sortase (surface protein transpeptidase)